MVSGYDTAAVIVADPPKLTVEPLMVTELLTKAALGMFDKEFDAAEIVLLVSVCTSDSVTTTPVSIEIVPVDVIGPPDRPVPVSIRVTEPAPAVPLDAAVMRP